MVLMLAMMVKPPPPNPARARPAIIIDHRDAYAQVKFPVKKRIWATSSPVRRE